MCRSHVVSSENAERQEEPCQGDQRVLRAAIIGVPNAGKTTLVNQLLGQKVSKPYPCCGLYQIPLVVTTSNKMGGVFVRKRHLLPMQLFAVSPKKHTTTRNAVGVFTQGNSQIVSYLELYSI